MYSSEVSHLLQAAGLANAAGHHAEAIKICEQVRGIDPENIQATLLLGISQARCGNLSPALHHLSKVFEKDRQSYYASFWLSLVARSLKLSNLAIEAARRCVSLRPMSSEAHGQLGVCLLDDRYLQDAERTLRTAIELAPQTPQLLCSLAHCLSLRWLSPEAAKEIQQALELCGPNFEYLLRWGAAMLSETNWPGALAFGRKALELNPSSVAATILVARALMEVQRGAEASQLIQTCADRGSTDPELFSLWGTVLQSLGQISEAGICFQRSLEINPSQGFAFFAILHNRRVTADDDSLLEQMRCLLAKNDLGAREQSELHYGLGKAEEDTGRFREAMYHYDHANAIDYRIKFGQNQFDRQVAREQTRWAVEQFSTNRLEEAKEDGLLDDTPIFIVGMMRSGTTLLEQILSSHPQVGAGGEQVFWPNNWREAMHADGRIINHRALRPLAERYLAALRAAAPGFRKVVDKMPINYSGVGIIHSALPKAKFIHIKRHAVDNCLSIYATPNRASVTYAHDRDNIVFAYRQYLEVTDHWRKALPQESFKEISYEDLVSHSEKIVRDMIEVIGLEWDYRCLRHQDNARTVLTPSVWQVRQPIYRTSIARWRKFEPWLGPFADLLDASEREMEKC
jgi:tetratricopeptide (TPR) repeat protein